MRIAAILFCGYILLRCHVDFAMGSRMVSSSARDLREANSTVDVPQNLDIAAKVINRSLHPLTLATLALVLLGIFPYANLKWKRKTEPKVRQVSPEAAPSASPDEPST
jgi:hypothetical protein